MSFEWFSYGNYTRIEWWPAFEPKPDSEQAADVREHLMFPGTCLDKMRSNVASNVDKISLVPELISLVGKFNLKKARRAQSWPVFVPKPEADSVVNVV